MSIWNQEYQLTIIDNNVDDIETLLNTVDGKIDTISGNVDDTETLLGVVDGKADTISGNVDDIETLLGTVDNKIDAGNAIADIIEEHFHSRELWMGKSGDQTGNNWNLEGSLTAFQAISGDADYGSDDNDEAKIMGTADTPMIAGYTYFDCHRFLIVGVSNNDPYILRYVYGTGTLEAAISNKQYVMVMVKFDAINPQQSAGIPIELRMPRVTVGTKIWVQTKNGTNNATIDFFVGHHEYDL